MPQQYRQPRELPEPEFNAILDKLIAQAPEGLSEGDFDRWLKPRLEMAVAEAEGAPAPVEGSALGRFASGVGEMLNPVEIAKGVYGAVRHPIDTASNLIGAQADQFRKGVAALEGDTILGGMEAIGRFGAGVVPILGPMAAGAAERIAEGDVAGGAGNAAGMLAPVGIARGVRAARGAAPSSMAGALEQGAATRVSDVMAPKVGPNKMRFGRMADEVAPTIARDPSMAAWSREGLAAKVGEKFTQAEQALDAAADARLNARTFPTAPIIQDLLERRKALTAQTVEGSQPTRSTSTRTSPIVDESGRPIEVTTRRAEPIGRDVVPGPNADRVAVIDQAIKELRELGPVARYEPLRRIRQSYDGPAKAVYHPSMTQDFLKAQGGKFGAADVTGTLREHLARFDPQTAAANSEYSLWRKANDVLEATAEVERTRPRVGRVIASRIAATVFGGQAAGAPGAAAGLVGGPVIEAILSSAPTTRLQSAKLMSQLADAIRRGDVGHVNSLTVRLRQLAPTAAVGSSQATSAGSLTPTPQGAGAGQ